MKTCLLCLSECDSALATCPHCGEATWGVSLVEALTTEEAPAEEAPASKKGGKKK